jgi:hypothetical protein
MKKSMVIGKQDGKQVVLDWELKTENDVNGKLDVHLKPAVPYQKLSISAHSMNWGGQAYDELLELDELYMDKNDLLQMIEYWKEWHLNDARAWCIHQKNWNRSKKLEIVNIRVNTWKMKDKELAKLFDVLKYNPKNKHEFNVLRMNLNNLPTSPIGKMIKKVKLMQLKNMKYEPEGFEKSWFDNGVIEYKTEEKIANWTYPYEHPDGILCKECPECGYKYGTNWLIEYLPQEVIDFFVTLPASIDKSKQINEIDEWLKNHNIKCNSIFQEYSNPNMDSTEMDHWKLVLECNEVEKTFYYSTGFGHRLLFDRESSVDDRIEALKVYFKQYQDRYGQMELRVNDLTYPKDQGVAKPPLVKDVWHSMLIDIAYLWQHPDFEEFGNELGFDMLSKSQREKASKTKRLIYKLERNLNELIGNDLVEEYIDKFMS